MPPDSLSEHLLLAQVNSTLPYSIFERVLYGSPLPILNKYVTKKQNLSVEIERFCFYINIEVLLVIKFDDQFQILFHYFYDIYNRNISSIVSLSQLITNN